MAFPITLLRGNVRQSIDLARDLDNKIDNLITLVIAQEGGSDEFVVAFCSELDVVLEYQSNLKNAFMESILEFCHSDEDHNLLKLGDLIHPMLKIRRNGRSDHESAQVAAKIDSFMVEENKLLQTMFDCTSIFQEPHTKGNFGSHGLRGINLRESLGLNHIWSLRNVMSQMNQFSGETAGSDLEILRSFAPAGFLIFESEEYKGKKETLATLCSGTNGVSDVADVTARMMDQLNDIEKVVAFLVYTFHSSTLSGEMSTAKLANVINHLEELRQNRKGRVPVVVYWAIDYLKGRIDVEMNEEEGETVDFLRSKLDYAVTIVEKVILRLVLVLNASTLPNSDELQKKALLASFSVLQECENMLRSVQDR